MSSVCRCSGCDRRYPPGTRLRCECGELLEVEHEFPSVDREVFDGRLRSFEHPFRSGVWRFKELVYPELSDAHIISRPEGNTNLYAHRLLSEYVGVRRLTLKHEGENPTGSF